MAERLRSEGLAGQAGRLSAIYNKLDDMLDGGYVIELRATGEVKQFQKETFDIALAHRLALDPAQTTPLRAVDGISNQPLTSRGALRTSRTGRAASPHSRSALTHRGVLTSRSQPATARSGR